MTEHIWRKASYLTGLLAITLLFGLIVLSANIEIKDLDLWLHLGVGNFILSHGYVPDVDILSCSIAGQPWVNHEWLFQIIASLAYRAGGAEGLLTMQVVIVAITFLVLLFLGYNRDKQFLVNFILLLVMLVYQTRFTVRPDIFSLFFFVLYIYILSLHLDKKWSLYALFAIQVLWANCHGFFFFGPLIVLIGILSEWMKRNLKLPWEWNKVGTLTNEEYGRLKKILIVVIAASFINPLTFKGAWYPIGVLINISGESRVFFNHIQELQPAFNWGNIFSTEPYPFYRILIVLSFVGLFLNRKKIDVGALILWIIFLVVSLGAIRNLVYFAFVAYLICLINFSSISWRNILPFDLSEKKQLVIQALLQVFLIAWMAQYMSDMTLRGYYDFDQYELKSEFGGITQRNYPSKAVDFLETNQIKGNFFNDFNSGAYLVGRVFPNIKVFIDGRTEVYGPKHFKLYRKIWAEDNVDALKSSLERYHITGALLNTVYEPAPEKVLNYFYNDPQWALVYFDFDALVFLKRTPENSEMIEKYSIDLTQWKSPEFDIKKFGPRSVQPYRYLNRAYTLESLGLHDQAIAEAELGLKLLPNYTGLYKLLGKAYGKKNDHMKAFENFRIAVMYASNDPELRYNLALAYYKINDFEHAIKQYQAIIKNQPNNPKAYFLVGKVYAEDKQYDKAYDVLSKGHRLNPHDVQDLLDVGDIIYKQEKFAQARKIYELARGTKMELATVHLKLGLCSLKEGDLKKAREEFQNGLTIDPKNEELKKSITSLNE